MAAAAAGGTRMICWPMAQQQVHVSGGGGGSGSGVASCSGGQGVVRRYADRLQVSRVLPVAVAAPSQFLVTRSSGMRGNLVLCSGKFEVRAVRGSGTRAVSQVVEATTAGLRETVEDTAVADGHSRSFEGIQTEQELMLAISKEVDSGRLPKRGGAGMEELYRNYRDAVLSSGVEDPMDVAVKVMATVLDRILLQFEDPFTFSSYHPRMTDPYDYYTFGQNYVRPLIDYRNSYLGNLEIFDKIEKNLKEGHNVILLSNHQTEADPAVMALLLEQTHPYLAENLTYVAGDRVVLDPFCKPFSMGRNLLCVYSKKHINDVPDLAEMKKKANAKTLMQMSSLLRKGGRLLWVAPSGGRDRPDPETNEWVPAPFDSSAVESMKRLSEVVRVPAHIHPMSLLCFEIMPPPVQVQKELGERRAVGFSGVGLAVSEELDFESIAKREANPQNLKDAISATAWNEVNDMYNALKAAIYGEQGCGSSTSSLRLEQPWLEESRLRV
ncbi:hypothetical protein M758_3G239800 [Ceratodon purpureus]|nr:hypothetical protein M758_3G239800 [Ceratodon purpureus]